METNKQEEEVIFAAKWIVIRSEFQDLLKKMKKKLEKDDQLAEEIGRKQIKKVQKWVLESDSEDLYQAFLYEMMKRHGIDVVQAFGFGWSSFTDDRILDAYGRAAAEYCYQVEKAAETAKISNIQDHLEQ